MNEFLLKRILDNQVQDYLVTFLIIIFFFFLAKLVSRYLAHLICRLFRRNWKTFDEKTFTILIVRPLSTFFLVAITIAALYRLNFPNEWKIRIYKYSLQDILEAIGIIIFIAVFIWVLLRIIDFIAHVLQKRARETVDQGDNQLIVFFKDFLKVIIGIIGILMILHLAFNYNVSSLLTGLSIVGAAIALALKESLENLIASFVIFFDKPFTTGDFVRVQTVAGTVERIGLRSTRIRTADKTYVTVPNKQMVDSILDNISLRSQIRGELQLQIHLQTPPAQIEQLITSIKSYLKANKDVSSFTVAMTDIRQHAFVVLVEFFTPHMAIEQFVEKRESLYLFILKEMDAMQIRHSTEPWEGL
jgi:MscS family membrane protein